MDNISINTDDVRSFTRSELDTLRSTIAKGTSNEQFALFVQTCVRSGLNPFLNQIYCNVYNGKKGPKMTIQITVEGIIALAKRHPQYKGFIASEVKENDEFEIDMVTGEPKHRIMSMQRGKTIGAYCVAYRENAPNIAVIISTEQVEHLIKGKNSQMWKDYFDDMIVKHAIKRAFKRQYGIEVAEDENTPTNYISSSDFKGNEVVQEVGQVYQTKKTLSKSKPKDKLKEDDDTNNLKKARAEMKRKFAILGINEKEKMSEYIINNCKIKGDKPTLSELLGLLKVMDLHIEEKKANSSNSGLLA